MSFSRGFRSFGRALSATIWKPNHSKKYVTAGICALCGFVIARKYIKIQYYFCNYNNSSILKELQASSQDVAMTQKNDEEKDRNENATPDVYQHARERRFYEFASLEIEDERFMTPQDFLESVTEENPRPRLGLRKISRSELSRILKSTPARRQSSKSLFRNIHENGVISYSEYLFLLCILTKPEAGFKIAFKMFDTDGNERVDKQEFLVLEEIFRKKTEKSSTVKEVIPESSMEEPRSQLYSLSDVKWILNGDEKHVLDTSLLVYFFGLKGKDTLSFQDFYQFMENLQTEVLEIEFLTYSHGMPTISEEDFARSVLKYTDAVDEDEYLEKLRARIPEEMGLTFDEYRAFFRFLNNLEDFAVSVSMYAISGRAIGEDEFRRAVKVTTGQHLSQHLVHTLYQLFDKDGDGKLSYVEFIGVMKDRLNRGFRVCKSCAVCGDLVD